LPKLKRLPQDNADIRIVYEESQAQNSRSNGLTNNELPSGELRFPDKDFVEFLKSFELSKEKLSYFSENGYSDLEQIYGLLTEEKQNLNALVLRVDQVLQTINMLKRIKKGVIDGYAGKAQKLVGSGAGGRTDVVPNNTGQNFYNPKGRSSPEQYKILKGTLEQPWGRAKLQTEALGYDIQTDLKLMENLASKKFPIPKTGPDRPMGPIFTTNAMSHNKKESNNHRHSKTLTAQRILDTSISKPNKSIEANLECRTLVDNQVYFHEKNDGETTGDFYRSKYKDSTSWLDMRYNKEGKFRETYVWNKKTGSNEPMKINVKNLEYFQNETDYPGQTQYNKFKHKSMAGLIQDMTVRVPQRDFNKYANEIDGMMCQKELIRLAKTIRGSAGERSGVGRNGLSFTNRRVLAK
jgi:hypothetical protein